MARPAQRIALRARLEFRRAAARKTGRNPEDMPARALPAPVGLVPACANASCDAAADARRIARGTAAAASGLLIWGRPLWLVDSITEAAGKGAGAVVVSGSHGGLSAARYALEAQPHVVVFNDAGVGKDGAGIVALWRLQDHGIAAVAVAHDSARIGEALSTWRGVISFANAQAIALGARTGLLLQQWLQTGVAETRFNGS
jgi:hypothetical protein